MSQRTSRYSPLAMASPELRSNLTSPIEPPSLPPPRRFSEMDLPITPARGSSALKRLARATRKIIIGRTPAERAAKAMKELERQEAARKWEREEAIAGAQARREAIQTGHLPMERLRRLAEHEGVYLNPRATRSSRFHHEDYDLQYPLVARVSGRCNDGGYIFLGSDQRLYRSTNELGRGAAAIPRGAEEQYCDFREIARAYYQLCE